MSRHSRVWLLSCLALSIRRRVVTACSFGQSDPARLVCRSRSARLRRTGTGSIRPTRRPTTSRLFMDAFSSTDLVTWTKHARILDIANVKWARRAMWAPSIVEKDGWYYLFFGANDIQNDQQVGGIGVARARQPQGPFEDYLGKPLIDRFHNGAQPIDQFVFKDRDGVVLHRLRRLAALQHRAAERRLHRLRAVSRRHDVQGDHAAGLRRRRVHAPEGRQVLLHVVRRRLDRPELRRGVRDRRRRRSGRSSASARSCSRIRRSRPAPAITRSCRRRRPGKWYIVYHRRPLGETDRNHRVVCIDELRFDEKGFILPVVITKEGVASDPVRGQ